MFKLFPNYVYLNLTLNLKTENQEFSSPSDFTCISSVTQNFQQQQVSNFLYLLCN